jgi:hypothetical protein
MDFEELIDESFGGFALGVFPAERESPKLLDLPLKNIT